jgi:tRNA pseudouridine55 synthase
MDGLLVVDKPVGPTSHDVVARMRRTLDERRIGHTGTLDPSASGVLALVLGRATRLARFIAAGEKRYTATIRLGVETDTYDGEGRVVRRAQTPVDLPSPDDIGAALDNFRGTFEQRPPAFSAKKIAGRRSYAIARAAADHDPASPKAAVVTAHSIVVVGHDSETVTLDIVCSPGFYVRSLAHDLGERLGIGAHVVELRRTRSGDLDVGAAVPLATLESNPATARAAVVPLASMLPSFEAAMLSAEGVRHAVQGRPLGPGDVVERRGTPGADVRLFNSGGELVGIAADRNGTGLLHPCVILV